VGNNIYLKVERNDAVAKNSEGKNMNNPIIQQETTASWDNKIQIGIISLALFI